MKNKGFSLVELLAVIVVLGLIIGISIPIINGSLNKSKEKALNEQITQIIKAAKKYALENSNVLPDESRTESCITLRTLIEKNFIDTEKVINPVTDLEMSGAVLIRYWVDNIEYAYSYVEGDTCER